MFRRLTSFSFWPASKVWAYGSFGKILSALRFWDYAAFSACSVLSVFKFEGPFSPERGDVIIILRVIYFYLIRAYGLLLFLRAEVNVLFEAAFSCSCLCASLGSFFSRLLVLLGVHGRLSDLPLGERLNSSVWTSLKLFWSSFGVALILLRPGVD